MKTVPPQRQQKHLFRKLGHYRLVYNEEHQAYLCKSCGTLMYGVGTAVRYWDNTKKAFYTSQMPCREICIAEVIK